MTDEQIWGDDIFDVRNWQRNRQPGDNLISVSQAARRLNCHGQTIRNYIQERRYVAFRAGDGAHWRLLVRGGAFVTWREFLE